MACLTVLFKPVSSRCNLKCRYCYYLNVNNGRIKLMSNSLAERASDSLTGANLSLSNIKFIWHGGEPMLAGRNFFNYVCELQRQKSGKNFNLKNSIQTNGTLITPEWCKFFKEYDFSIGLSLDGPPEIHNAQRVYPDGEGSCSQTLAAINLIKNFELKLGALATITKESLGKERIIYEFFLENGITDFDIIPCFCTGDPEQQSYAVSPAEWRDFMINVFDLWFADDDPKIRIRFFENIVKGILGLPPGLCTLSDNCQNFITIECDGSVYPCDDFANKEEFCFGNITEDSLENILQSKNRKNFFNSNWHQLRKNCSGCNYYYLCGGGCPKHQNYIEEVCKARKIIFNHVENKVRRAQSASLRNGGDSNGSITGKLQGREIC